MPPKKSFSPEQQEFLDHLVEEVGHRIAEILFQKGIGAQNQVQSTTQQPQQAGRPPQQVVRVMRRTPSGDRPVDTSVPQLLAEQNDHLIFLISRIEVLIQNGR